MAVLLDLENQMMNVYWNGKLQTDDSRPGGPSLIGVVGPVRPAFTVYGSIVQLSLQTGVERPAAYPGKISLAVVHSLRGRSLDFKMVPSFEVPPDKSALSGGQIIESRMGVSSVHVSGFTDIYKIFLQCF